MLKRLFEAIGSEVGRDEVMLIVALALLAGGFWLVWWPASLLIPGAVVLWVYLPQRVAFIERQPEKPRRSD